MLLGRECQLVVSARPRFPGRVRDQDCAAAGGLAERADGSTTGVDAISRSNVRGTHRRQHLVEIFHR